MITVDSYGLTEAGTVRSENQDRIRVEPELGLFAVCDGMGGHRDGQLAAELALSTISHFLEASRDRLDVTWPFGYDFGWSVDANRLITAIRLANRVVWRRSEQAAEHAGMGTTVAAALVQADHAVLANVGDSRIYRFRRGQFQQLSVDDTLVANLVEQGLVPLEEMGTHPLRNVLTQAAGAQEEITVHVREESSESGDCLLLCSDGLHGVVSEETVCGILAAEAQARQCAQQLMEQALQAGAPDNIAIVLLRYI